MRMRLPNLTLAGVMLVLVAGCSPGGEDRAPIGASPRAVLPTPGERPPGAEIHLAPGNLPDFTALVRRQGPAVVNVVATRAVESTQSAAGDPFFEFFRRFFPAPHGPGRPGPGERGLGSGFIISADGYILTNAHVIAQADRVVVRLSDAKKDFVARVIGVDPRTDVALIKVDARDLPIVRIGDSTQLEVGEWVAAIGSPFGFDNTITAGIVSAKGRNFPTESFVPYIQTDVAVNPGNSGGPLLNLRGEVVGINAMIYTRTGGYMGVSFAIPIEVAMEVAQQLRASGRVSRGRLGVTIQELTPELARSFRVPDAAGVLVTGVERGSPAETAGLQPGDVIRVYNGEIIDDSAELPRLVASTKPGSAAKLQVWREGDSRQVSVMVGEYQTAEVPVPKPAQAAAGNQLGLELRPLTPTESKALDVPFGLIVESVSGPASATRIEPGDVIVRVGQTPLTSSAQFRQLLEARERGDPVPLLVRRGDHALFVVVNVA